MSLTSHLGDEKSPIFKYFNNNFEFSSTLDDMNRKLRNAPTLVPENQADYPWANAGHVIEYMMNLHLGVKMRDLFPMKYYEKKDALFRLAINLEKKPFENMDLLIIVLYKLAQFESRWRNNRYKYSVFQEATPALISDMKQLFERTKKNPFFAIKEGKDSDFIYNPTFSLSMAVGGADADFIKITNEGNLLVDIKTTKYSQITPLMLHQLLGYHLLDKLGLYQLKNIGIYLPRQDIIVTWSIKDLIQYCSSFESEDEAKSKFYQIFKG